MKEDMCSSLYVFDLKCIAEFRRGDALTKIGGLFNRNTAFIRKVVIPWQLQSLTLEVADFKGAGDAAVFAILSNESAAEYVRLLKRAELSSVGER